MYKEVVCSVHCLALLSCTTCIIIHAYILHRFIKTTGLLIIFGVVFVIAMFNPKVGVKSIPQVLFTVSNLSNLIGIILIFLENPESQRNLGRNG